MCLVVWNVFEVYWECYEITVLLEHISIAAEVHMFQYAFSENLVWLSFFSVAQNVGVGYQQHESI